MLSKFGVLPFEVRCKPVFDNERFVYFQASWGKQFGRLDLDAMAFETLAEAMMYASRYGMIKGWQPEMLALCAPDGAFFLLVCDGEGKQPWKIFSSATDSWTDINITMASCN